MTDLKKLLDEAPKGPIAFRYHKGDGELFIGMEFDECPGDMSRSYIEGHGVLEKDEDNEAFAALICAAVNAVPELLAIKQAVSDYHFALDSRDHGGVAANRLVDAVQSALGQHWVRGAEAERRAALNQEPGQ